MFHICDINLLPFVNMFEIYTLHIYCTNTFFFTVFNVYKIYVNRINISVCFKID